MVFLGYFCLWQAIFFICSSFHWSSLLFKVSMLSFNFDVKDVFWGRKVGKTLRAFIAMVPCSDLNVQLFISLVFCSIECLPVELEDDKNSDFLQWTTVLYTSLNLFFINLLSGFQIFSLFTVTNVKGKRVVDVVSITFGLITSFSLHTPACWFSPRNVFIFLFHLFIYVLFPKLQL